MLTWKNHNDGKNHGSPQAAEYTMREKVTMEETQRQRPLAPLLRNTTVTMGATTSFSLSLSIHSFRSVHIQLQKCSTTTNCFALSHIYTHMTFGLFTHVASRGSLAHIHVCVSSKPVQRSPPDLRSSGSP